MFFRLARQRVTLDCGDEMITKQAMKDECDIHRILRQYQRTGIITHIAAARPTYEDLPSELDFQTAQNIIIEAETAFAGLPSSVRERFANDPARFLRAFADPEQSAYLREMGFLKPSPDNPATQVADNPTGAA